MSIEKEIPKHKTTTASIIKDGSMIAELEKARAEVFKGKGDAQQGYWALLSVEDPAGDEEGDVIAIDGITSDIDPSNEKFLPLLPAHQKKLEGGKAATIGRIEMLQKTSVNGMNALAMYFTFALDKDGKPIDELVKGYYDRYRLGYLNSFSVGMDPQAQPERINKTGGFHYPKTKLYEASCVSIGGNRHAVGLTRSKADEDEIVKAIADLRKMLDGMASAEQWKATKEAVDTLGKAFEDRMDAIEAALVARPQPEPVTKAKDDSTSEYIAELKRIAEKIKLP